MRTAAFLLFALLVSGCMSQEVQVKPDDAKMDALFADAIGGNHPQETSTTVQTLETTLPQVPEIGEPSSTTFQTTTSSMVSSSTSSSFTSTTIGVECSKIQAPMGQADCGKGHCPTANSKCRYYPGTLYKTSRCVCILS